MALFYSIAGHNALPAASNFLVINRGDFNADGHITIDDIPAMLNALTDLSAYQSNHNFTASDLLNVGDVDGDEKVTNRDIQALLDLLSPGDTSSATAVPEPDTMLIAIAGIFAVMAIRHHCRIILF